MKQTIRVRVRFLIIILVLTLVAALVTTVVCAREYKSPVYYTYNDIKVLNTDYTTQNDNVELKDVSEENGIVFATFVPKSVGYDEVSFYTKTENPDYDAEVTLQYWAGPLGTIFCFDFQIDFKGSLYIIVLILLGTAVFAAVLLYTFFDYARKAEFGYPMVACGGIGLFLIQYLIANVDTLIGSFTAQYQFGFGNFLYELANSGDVFSGSTAVIMIVFCFLLIVSNIWLIRHEGYRIQNLLGVILGFLWGSGYTVNRFFADMKYFDLSYFYTVISNAIAVLISYFVCMLFSAALSAFLASCGTPPFDRDYVVIFGCAIRKVKVS